MTFYRYSTSKLIIILNFAGDGWKMEKKIMIQIYGGPYKHVDVSK